MFLNKTFYNYLLLLFLSFITVKNKAQNWTGNINSDWNNSGNWSSWPLNGSDILIDPANYTGAASSPVIFSNSVFNPAGLIIQNGASLAIQGDLTTTKRIELLGNGTQMSITAGTVFASGAGSQGRLIVSDGASVLQNGGMAKASQRIIVELGGNYTLNNGVVNPLQELAIGDGNASGSSLFTMNGGSVNIGLDLGFENEAGTFYPTFNMTGGTLNVGNDVTWLGEAPGSGSPRFIMSGGNAIIGGSILNTTPSTVDLYLETTGTASLSVNGPFITLVNTGDSIKQSGQSLFTLQNSVTISNPGVWLAGGGTLLLNGNTSVTGTGSYQFHHTVIHSPAVLNHLSPATISVNGNFTSNGSFNANSNEIIFSGNSTQFITAANTCSFYDFTLANAAGLTLNQNIVINNHLQLNAGKLYTSQNSMVTIADNATASSGSLISFINGPVKKTGNDAFVFPVGKNNKWRRLAITAPASANSEFVAEYFDNSYSPIQPVNLPLNAVSNIEYWKLQRFNSGDPVKITLHWENAAISAINNCTVTTIAGWNGSSWENNASTASGICTGNGAGSMQSDSLLNNLGVFTFGFKGNTTSQNITLCNGESMTVGQNTYTSSGTYIDVLTAADLSDSTVITQLNILPPIINNQSVSICYGGSYPIGLSNYSAPGIYSDTLASVNGCDSIVNTTLTIKNPVNTSVTQNGIELSAATVSTAFYQWVDCQNNFSPVNSATLATFIPTQNGNYAVIVTENNCSDTSSCFNVSTVGLSEWKESLGINIYPNPFNEVLIIETDHINDVKLKLLDLQGKILLQKTSVEKHQQIDLAFLPPGMYLLEVTREEKIFRKKVVRQ